MNFEQIIMKMNELMISIKDNKILMLILVILLSSYASLWVKSLQKYTINIFSNKYFKFGIFLLITYIANNNPALGIILAIAMLVTLQTITYTNIQNHKEDMENFYNENDENDENGEIFLNNPLLKQNEMTKRGDELDLKLQTPKEMYKEMIMKGKDLLYDSMEMNNEFKKRYDYRELSIAENAKREGELLIESGINRLQESDNGVYKMQNNIKKNMDENDTNKILKSKYVKYDRYLENKKGIESMKEELNNLKKIYNDTINKNNKKMTQIEFNEKIKEMETKEMKILMMIYENKKYNLTMNEKDKIMKQIEKIDENRKNNKNNEYEIRELSNLLC